MDPVVISPWSPAIWSSSLIILCFFLWSWYPWRVLTSDFAEFSSILILLMSSHDWTKVLCIPGNQFSSVAQSCPALCDPRNCSTPGLPVHHQLPEFTQTHVHRVGDVIQPSHPLSSPLPPSPNPSQHQSLFQLVNSSHEVAKVLEFQL